MKYRNWKQILALGMGISLIFSQTTYANVTMIGEPLSIGNSTESASAVSALPVPDASTSGFGKGNVLVAGSGVTAAQQTPVPTQATTPAAEETSTSVSDSQPQTVQSEIAKPTVSSEGAVLLDAATGQVLFGKNEDQQFYPASITKVMTALLVLEHCNLNDIVTFSASATTNLESGAVALGIVEGDQLTVEQCLYGLLLKSANEIGNGLAEHVAGSVSAFADMMNEKARALGCKNTHFVNPHGLNNTEHKTTPYDMALIMRAALQNETFRKIDTTTSYQFPATKNAGTRTITMGHKMMYPSDSRYYEGIIGGKTGYTSKAGNTLVTGVENNGVRLIAVIMKSQGTHYVDTKAMLDYGFAYCRQQNVSMSSTVSVPQQVSATSTAESSLSQNGGPGVSNPVASIVPAVTQTGWIQDSVGWYYVKSDGSRAKQEWMTLDGYDYWFDSNEYMATGWRQFDGGVWYYFRPQNGTMARGRWIEDSGAWYYLGDDGVMLANTTTPDGYRVDANGVWIP
ncbi:MAG: serine hydrolase [Brotaphodocola sp.]